jgi:hypothetical protein
VAQLHFFWNGLNVASLTLDALGIIERSFMHGIQHDSTSLKGINGHIVNPPPDDVLRSDTFSNLNKSSRSREEVHQAPMLIITRLVIQRMLFRSSDQSKVLLQPDLQEENKKSDHKEA